MNDDGNIPEERAVLFYIGNVLIVIGVLMFLSVMVQGFATFNRGPSFGPGGFSQSQPNPMVALIGMGLVVVGSICKSIGQAGLAGSGILLDPQQERRDLKPWSKMAGGMLDDALQEVEVVKNINASGREVIKIRCPKCRTLNDEEAKFCDQCGQTL